jgi:N-acyl homoserine lactone hydrolase
MMRRLTWLAISAFVNGLAVLPVSAQSEPELSLTRLDCGPTLSLTAASTELQLNFSDTFVYSGLNVQLVVSCYLIKHGEDYMLWDTGTSLSAGAFAPKVSLVELLSQIGLRPQQIKYVGISHYHFDHTSQTGSFPQSTLLIGKGDWDVLTSPNLPRLVDTEPLAHWISGDGKVEPVLLDRDIFGDGTAMMLNAPGHTPGHHVLLVKLPMMGNVLLSGDLAHFRENYDSNGVPAFNTNRAETLASIDRIKQIAKTLGPQSSFNTMRGTSANCRRSLPPQNSRSIAIEVQTMLIAIGDDRMSVVSCWSSAPDRLRLGHVRKSPNRVGPAAGRLRRSGQNPPSRPLSEAWELG